MMLKSLKQKIAKVGIGLFCAGCVFLSSAAYSQAASYTAYALKLNKTNNFTSMHAKTTSDDYITNEVTAITNTSYANFWAVNNSKSKISNKYKQNSPGSRILDIAEQPHKRCFPCTICTQ